MNSWKPSKGSRGCAQCLRRNHLKVAAPEPVIWVGAERRAEGKKKPEEINRLKVKGDFFSFQPKSYFCLQRKTWQNQVSVVCYQNRKNWIAEPRAGVENTKCHRALQYITQNSGLRVGAASDRPQGAICSNILLVESKEIGDDQSSQEAVLLPH